MSNFKKNWITMGYTLLILLALLCWPVTLVLLGVYIMGKICGFFFNMKL